MHVNTDGLRTGGNTTYTAADHTYEGAGTLSRAGVPAGIFGDFDAAHSFHETVSTAHQKHVTLINNHSDRLSIIGDKAHSAAADFHDMEKRNESVLKAVGDAAIDV